MVICGFKTTGFLSEVAFLETLLQLNFNSNKLIITSVKIEIVIVNSIDDGV